MNDALQIAATGMLTQQNQVRAIASNLGNMNTSGFKRVRLGFAEMLTRSGAPEVALAGDGAAPQAGPVSLGVRVTGSLRSFEAGEFRRTGAPLDVAVRGTGFLELSHADGSLSYWRGGSLSISPEGQLLGPGGLVLRPGITLPDNAQSLTISEDGRVTWRLAGSAVPQAGGSLQLVRFASPDALDAQGDNLYRPTDASGPPIAGHPGEEQFGLLAQGYLEASNVRMIDEMVGLMMAQNGYGACLKVVQAADEMDGLVNNLRR